ncbi:unnamed protein product [Calypogeia fissa]
MAIIRGSNVLLCLAAVCCFAASVRAANLYSSTVWQQNGHGTWYGGTDASGTMGGACGYGNLYSQGYGTQTAALSDVLFNDGLSCGACFELACNLAESQYCYQGGKSIIVTATNNCPQGSFGGWCDYPKPHFDLAIYAFQQLAPPSAGVFPLQYRRVSCVKDGGVRIIVEGNQWYFSITVYNVANAGNVVAISVQCSGTGFTPLAHSWGQVFTGDASSLWGKELSFEMTAGTDSLTQTLTFWNVAPSNWGEGQTYESVGNF